MRRMLATAALLALTTALAAAGVPKDGPDIVDAAFKKLDDRANEVRTQGTLPRWSIPADRAILAQIWDAPKVLGAAPYTAQDVNALINIGVRENAVLRSYVLYSDNAAVEPDPNKNMVTFQDEILRGEAFSAKLSAAMLSALGDYASHMKPEQLTGEKATNLKELRDDLVDRADAALETVGNPSLNVEDRTVLVNALTDSAAAIAAGSPLKNREDMAKTASGNVPLSPPEKEKMKAFADAMASTDCQALCKLP